MRKAFGFVVLTSALVAAGCVDAERINIRFDVDRNLLGMVSLEFLGIHSNAGKPEEQKEEMREFYESEYREDAARFEHEWALANSKTEFSNKTELRCDGKLVGEIEDLIKSLAPLVRERGTTYEIKRDASRFYFTARGGWDEHDSNISLSVRYTGVIAEHNAHIYDASAHLMEWNLGKLDDSGIHLVLELEPKSELQ